MLVPAVVLTVSLLAPRTPAPRTPAPQTPAPQSPAPQAGETPHVEWQRTLADALAVQKATGLPLLIAVNMDGEVFNDRFASSTYRDKEFIEATRGYVCVVASPDRHNERDYDATGNRVECPRFRGCTCSEHINIEPELFAKYFSGKRNAPRHVGVDKDGKILFDRFLDQSMQTAIDAIRQHKGDTSKQPGATEDLAELFARRDAFARRTIELRWKGGDVAQKRKLLEAASAAKNEPTDLLRAALREEDAGLFSLAALALAKHGGKDALIDLEDALARTGDAATQKALVDRLTELGKGDKAAERLASHFAPPKDCKVATPWGNAWAAASFDPEQRASIEQELDQQEAALRKNKNDDGARLALAVAQLALGELMARDNTKGTDLWFGDAETNAQRVGDRALREEAQGVIAWVAHLHGDYGAAGKAVLTAQSAAPSQRQPSPFLASRVLELAIQTTANGVFADANAADRSLRPELDRVLAMLALLREHKAVREPALLAAAGLLEFAGLRAQGRTLLEEAIARFPESSAAHERWRNRLLIDFGADAMRRTYAAYVGKATDAPTAEWFAGLASLTAALQHTRDQREPLARAAYDDAIARFAKSAAGNEAYVDTANHYAVLALAGRAEQSLAAGNADAAAADLLRAAELRQASFDQSDGLQRKPRAVAGRVYEALTKSGKLELAAKIKPLLF